nr:NADH dehydrogenase subunit 1 [Amblyseius tsugawai]
MLFMLFLMVLLSVAFFTLFERKFLGYLQLRKGPNKVFFLGIFQPVSDGVKLFMKGDYTTFMSNKLMFNVFPLFMLFLMMFYWFIFIFLKIDIFLNSLIYFMMISSLSIYGILGSGWVSNSKYGILGAYRSVAQVVSYEVGFVFVLMSLVMLSVSYCYKGICLDNGNSHYLFFGLIFVWFIWMVVLLAELNRAPFDFAESESELVSGFNVEFGGVKFAFMFLGEYGNMLFMGYMSMVLFHTNLYLFMIMYLVIMVWVRGVFPRYRYDNLMYLNWKVYLPFILFYFLYLFFYVCMVFY